jgi:hypothetical protein
MCIAAVEDETADAFRRINDVSLGGAFGPSSICCAASRRQ